MPICCATSRKTNGVSAATARAPTTTVAVAIINTANTPRNNPFITSHLSICLPHVAVALHTASPGEAGTQLTNEATYGAYARVNVARTTGGWTVTANSVSPVASIDFPEATSGTETITHFSVGSGDSNYMMYFGTVTPNIAVVTGVIPKLKTTSTITED